ncbi:D-alanine--D-alanine ligase family protein [Rhodococcus opacus]|uniref:D-alanine--D-alanine ligase n=1 Tax=Rhodococcus opacus TaxID=37919 RepID=A0AAX3YLK7_RHOOP|nr:MULTISPECIES: D-alanine--D-alanine ligase family protein [Rhodococcus]NHU41312.1 D-alanine--D-alanine ligase [Rhodococcus sp. A14]MBA8960418.1 D-alanine-D-alanine ligase [Rhodococcus opacus]MBP2205983.1 D-alanine-D-alanine ligase [Rhodococcus opacus]MCZ4585796.1 D-alanine--D-alanine ligase [Rhodococcus opacus]MDI9937016.1 D-alanine--D-alanine ligase family protein [Rhodococcus sp. IEGM 1351]
MSKPRTRVAVIFGGRSNEHSVSCVSAGSVLRNLDPERYEVVPIGITTEGSWVLGSTDPETLAIRGRALPSVDADGSALALTADPTRSGDLVALDDGEAGKILASVDVVFPVLHGAYGEDGTIQGLLELAGVPYVGPGVLASAAGMDKEFTKKLLAAEGLPIGYQVVLRPGTATLTDEQKSRLHLPVFVKPARGGSSIGITRVAEWAALDDAITHARLHDPKVIVESGIVGREVECGVLEFPDGDVRASVIAEIRMPEGAGDDEAFYDFDSKYLDDVCEFDVPAKLDESVSEEIRELAVRAFSALDCQGLARVDFFVTEDGPVINEINTMPGFTSISMYPRMWGAVGVDYGALVSTLVDTALARGVGLR